MKKILFFVVGFIIINAFSHDSLRQGLVADYNFGINGGAKLMDVSGFDNTGSLTNFGLSGATSNWAVSTKGMVLNFDGTDDYVNVGVSRLGLSPSKQFSVVAVVNQTSSPTNSLIISDRDVASPGASGWEIYFNGFVALRPTLLISNGSGLDYIGRDVNNTLSTNTWYHLVFTYDGSGVAGGINIYVNGVIAAVTDRTNGIGVPANFSNTQLKIGSRTASGSPGLYFPGYIGQIKIYNRKLLPEDVKKLYADSYQILTNKE